MANDPVAGQSGSQGGSDSALGTGQPAGGAASWFDTLPDGLKSDPSLQAFKGKDIAAVAESYVHAQKLVGGSIRVPGKDAKPEEKTAFTTKVYEALGRPASHDKYTVKAPGAAELGINWDEKRQGAILETAHKLGLSNEGAQSLVDFVADQLKSEQPDYAGDAQACIAALEKGDESYPGWGSTTPRFMGVAKRVVDTMFPAGTMEKLNISGLANDPGFIRGLYRLGKEMMEDGIISGEELNTSANENDSAQAKLDKMMKDQTHPYWVPTHPEHDKAVQEALELRRFLFG
jgi:hypothetical protein